MLLEDFILSFLPVSFFALVVLGLSYLFPDDEGYYGKRRKR